MADKGLKIGVWAFIIGLLLAVVLSLFSIFSGQTATPAWAIIVLAVLGLLVGLLNVTAQETQKFLIATIAFIVSLTALATVFATLGTAAVWMGLSNFFGLVALFMAPAAFIVAIKALYALARD